MTSARPGTCGSGPRAGKAPKIFYATRARRELELAATAAFEDIASAIAAQNPELDRVECLRSAQFILEGAARQIREGQYT